MGLPHHTPRSAVGWCQRGLLVAVRVLALVAASLPQYVHGQAAGPEFATLRLTRIDGSLSLRQSIDQAATRPGPLGADGPPSEQSDQNQAIVFALATQGYAYHPNLVSLNLGLGLTLQRTRVTTEAAGPAASTTANNQLYDFSARATFLRDKPYTGTLFYERVNPSVTLGPALVILQHNTRQGLQLALLAPATPVPLTFEATRQQSTGRGSGRVFDDTTDRRSFTADRAIGRLGHINLRVDDSYLDSRSGSTDLPIAHTTNRNTTAGIDTRLRFGADERFHLTHVLSYNALAYGMGDYTPPNRKDLRGMVDLRTRHSSGLQSFITVDSMDSRQGTARTRNRFATAGGNWMASPGLSASLDARSEGGATPGLATDARSVSASTDYRRPLAGGLAQAGYGVRQQNRSQSASALTTPVTGERHVLVGINFVALDRPRVVANSLTLQNEARTQTFVEGRDYEVSGIGSQTRMQRLVTGDILDGQTVLADYAVQTGGSFATAHLDQNLNLTWSWASRFSVYARWFNSAVRLTAGTPTFEVNNIRSTTLGAQLEWPLATLGRAGGSVEIEDRRETTLPLKRTNVDVFFQWEDALLGHGGLRVGARRQRVDYEQSSQDVNLAGHDIRYHAMMSSGIDLQAEWSVEVDSGTAVRRRRELTAVKARWLYRQLQLSLSVNRSIEQQAALRTRRVYGLWTLKREF